MNNSTIEQTELGAIKRNRMNWKKSGLIYVPTGELWWAKNYAMVPTIDFLNEQIIRVYFASLDENKFGRIGYADLDIDNPNKILYLTKEPVLDIGDPGTFDDCGVVPSCVITKDGDKYLYYIGFQRAEKVPYMLFTGLAIKNKNSEQFQRYSRAPILDRTNEETFSRSAPFILTENNIFKMWYWSCVKWSVTNNKIHYNNVIRYAESVDGINWQSHKQICIEPNYTNEYALGRPCVIRENNIYKMWYSIRSHNDLYLIGYAESKDGLNWIRKDKEVGITKSSQGWDAEMVCYSYVIKTKRGFIMFYNGNSHGATGFGYAVLEEK